MGLLNRALRKFGLELRPVPALDDLVKLTIVPTLIDAVPIIFAVSFKDDHIQRHHYAGEFYEADELKKIGSYFNGGTFVDIGANVGNHSIYAAKFLKADKIIAFEPGPLAVAILRCNVGLNDLGKVVSVHQVALSDRAGTATFDSPMPFNLGGARVHIDQAGETPVLRGDDALAGERVDFVKIDTEGLETEVLSGLVGTLKQQRPTVFVEVADENADQCESILEECGYLIVEKARSYENMANWIATASS